MESLHEALQLGCRLLWYGSKPVQNTLEAVMHEDTQGAFCGSCNTLATALQGSIKGRRVQREKADGIKAEDDDDDDDADGGGMIASPAGERSLLLLWRMLQLMCEGHNHNSQELLRDQEATIDNRLNFNLVETANEYLEQIAKDKTKLALLNTHTTHVLGMTLDFLIEVTQGPCSKNQELLAGSSFIASCQTILEVEFDARKTSVRRRKRVTQAQVEAPLKARPKHPEARPA